MMPTREAALVRAVLDEYGEIASRGIEQYLDRARNAEHLGPLLADYPSRGGRSLRASLCIAAARAFGAPLNDAVKSAVSLELLHNAFLVHDDIEDDSEERRRLPALHVLHGVPTALNVGDGLAVLSLGPLIDNHATLGPRVAHGVFREAHRMAQESVEGQALELAWRHKNDVQVTSEDYFRMVLKKTCWYTTIYPCRVGAMIGHRRDISHEGFVRFGFLLGAAFQIQDDVLNLAGDHGRYGKELGGDIREGKRTLMLIHLLHSAPPAVRSELHALLALPRRRRGDDEVAWVQGLMRRHGSIEHAKNAANQLAGAAAFEFGIAFREAPRSRDRDFIEALPHWILERA